MVTASLSSPSPSPSLFSHILGGNDGDDNDDDMMVMIIMMIMMIAFNYLKKKKKIKGSPNPREKDSLPPLPRHAHTGE